LNNGDPAWVAWQAWLGDRGIVRHDWGVKHVSLLVAGLVALTCLRLTAAESSKIDVSKIPLPVPRKVNFEVEIYPLLKESCFGCHGPEKQKGKYRCDTKAGAFKDTDYGPTVVPGRSEQSVLIHLVCGLIDEMLMPPPSDKPGQSEKLSPEQIGILRAWIDQGAEWPEGPIKEVEKEVTFAREVAPVLKSACGGCHEGTGAKGGFGVQTREAVLKGGTGYGAVIKPGDVAKSTLLIIVAGKDEDLPAPERHTLPAKVQTMLRAWIAQGAK